MQARKQGNDTPCTPLSLFGEEGVEMPKIEKMKFFQFLALSVSKNFVVKITRSISTDQLKLLLALHLLPIKQVVFL